MSTTLNESTHAANPWAYLLLAVGVLANVAAFSNRAVYIDEHLFLSVARMSREWGILAGGEWIFFGTPAPLASHTHSPFGEYCLGLLFWIFGGFDEATFRLTFASFFSIIAAWSFYGLARRVSGRPCLLTLLMMATPSFFVFSQTLMMDIPMLALVLAGLNLYLRGAEGSTWQLLAAAVSLIGAVAFGYAALVPVACMLATAIWLRRPSRELIAIGAPFVALLVWGVALWVHYGDLPFLKTAGHLSAGSSVLMNFLAMPSFLGGVTVVPWLALLIRKREWRRSAAIVFCSGVLAALFSLGFPWVSRLYGFWYIVLASAGISLAVLFAKEIPARLRSNNFLEIFMAFAFPAALGFFMVVGEFVSARYLLLVIPSLCIVVFAQASRRELSVMLATTLPLSIAIAVADYRFVNSYRAWVDAHVVPIQSEGFRVWNSGESGLRFYLEEIGAPTLSSTDVRPRSGDLIVRQTMFRYSLPERVEIMLVPLKNWLLLDRFPLRTFNAAAGAGFHGSGLGMVPFIPSRKPYDLLEIVEITPLADAKPPAVYSEHGPILIQREPELSFESPLLTKGGIEYEVHGLGKMETAEGRVVFRKTGGEEVVWRNFRIVPDTLAETR